MWYSRQLTGYLASPLADLAELQFAFGVCDLLQWPLSESQLRSALHKSLPRPLHFPQRPALRDPGLGTVVFPLRILQASCPGRSPHQETSPQSRRPKVPTHHACASFPSLKQPAVFSGLAWLLPLSHSLGRLTAGQQLPAHLECAGVLLPGDGDLGGHSEHTKARRLSARVGEAI